LARLSNRPRSTSSRSARRRGDFMAVRRSGWNRRPARIVEQKDNQLVEAKPMRAFGISLAATLIAGTALSAPSAAQTLHVPSWKTYWDESTGTRVDFPEGLFVPAGSPSRGAGRRFRTPDGRAELSIYTLNSARGETPHSYLQNNLKVPRRVLDYERVTRQFFAVSALHQGRVYYSRCNFAADPSGPMHCIYLAYPARETKAWDAVVTRISRSLRPRLG
jgi:hypothetical protein